MCSLKRSGGLTRGRVMDGITRTIWVLSRPVCISVIEHLRSLLSLNYQTSHQHAKISDAVLKRDEQGMKSSEELIDERDIFGGDLRNIANGMIANGDVNVEESLRVGERILTKMEGFPVKDYVFKKSDKSIQIPCLSEIKIGKRDYQYRSDASFPEIGIHLNAIS